MDKKKKKIKLKQMVEKMWKWWAATDFYEEWQITKKISNK